jgi:hypothetical protein
MAKRLTYRWEFVFGLAVLLGLFSFENTYAQRINFSTWTGSDDITITPVMSTPSLNFNQKQANISANSPAVAINLSDAQAVAFRIQAPVGFDLTVEVVGPTDLSLVDGTGQPDELIPFRLGIAYNNLLAIDEISAKGGAIQLPPNFTNVTFPVSRRNNTAPPGPPPTPLSGTDTRPKATAWLFIYGELGPIGLVNAGNYLGDITINVFFTSND